MENGKATRWMVKVKISKSQIGIYTYANKNKYEGQWKEGKKDGNGKIGVMF